MNLLLTMTLCALCTLQFSKGQDDYDMPPPEFEGELPLEEEGEVGDPGENAGFQKLNKGQPSPGGQTYQHEHKEQEGNPEDYYVNDDDPKEAEPDDDDPHVQEMLKPYINRGPPTRGESYNIPATMYTHLWIRRTKSVIQTTKSKATVTPTVFWDQYFLKNRLKSKIKVHHVKTHYRREYRQRLDKMVNQGIDQILHNRTHYSWDELMDEYRPFREEQMIKADDRIFNKFVRRMDTVLQSGRFDKWHFHQNTTHKPWANAEQNLIITDRIDRKMIMEIRSLARLLRKDVHKYFDILDNHFLRTFFRIPYNHSLYYEFPQPLNYTEQF